MQDPSSVYDPQQFRQLGHHLVDLLADYLSEVRQGSDRPVLPHRTPDEMLEQWPGQFPVAPQGNLIKLLEKTLDQAIHLHHPRYAGHQVTAPLPQAALADLLDSMINNGCAVFEHGPVNTVMEKRVIQWMASLLGFGEEADGFFTSGGTLGNLTALLAARQAKAGYDVWQEGLQTATPLAVMVSAQSHYSVRRACQVMGLGAGNVLNVPTDDQYRMDASALEGIYQQAVGRGQRVIAVAANACSTATGSYDPLEPVAAFSRRHDLWLHVDGAHGASALLSEKYRGLLRGIEHADSVVWDAHKMLLMPALVTAVVFRQRRDSYAAFSQHASYLFEKAAPDEWYNLGQRTMECTKKSLGLKLYCSLMHFGTQLFADYVTHQYDQARWFAAQIRAAADFELAVEPQANIVCLRYMPPGERPSDDLQRRIRKEILRRQRYYIVQTDLPSGTYLRVTIINPHTRDSDLMSLLDEVREVVRQIRAA